MRNIVVVGSDGSPDAQHAVAYAAALAHGARAEVVVVHATDSSTPAPPEHSVLAELGAPLEAAGVAWRSEARVGWAPQVLVDVARETNALCVVVGCRGAHADADLSLGTTSHWLTHRAPVPVLVVPSAQRVAPVAARTNCDLGRALRTRHSMRRTANALC